MIQSVTITHSPQKMTVPMHTVRSVVEVRVSTIEVSARLPVTEGPCLVHCWDLPGGKGHGATSCGS